MEQAEEYMEFKDECRTGLQALERAAWDFLCISEELDGIAGEAGLEFDAAFAGCFDSAVINELAYALGQWEEVEGYWVEPSGFNDCPNVELTGNYFLDLGCYGSILVEFLHGNGTVKLEPLSDRVYSLSLGEHDQDLHISVRDELREGFKLMVRPFNGSAKIELNYTLVDFSLEGWALTLANLGLPGNNAIDKARSLLQMLEAQELREIQEAQE